VRLPTTEAGLYAWFVALMAAYMIAAVIANLVLHRSLHGPRASIARVFDAATFAGSLALVIGIFDPKILALLGNKKPFLAIAGVAGIVYSVGALFPARATREAP